jgi:hypothetical protein
MAYYLVTATPREDLLAELSDRLERDEFVTLRPFGRALMTSLRRARRLPSGKAMWEEEDYCRPPLAQEREAVLDRYFDQISVEAVAEGTGWALIEPFPALVALCIPVAGIIFHGLEKVGRLRVEEAKVKSGQLDGPSVAELAALRDEMGDVRRELSEVQERLDFAERLLTSGRAQGDKG